MLGKTVRFCYGSDCLKTPGIAVTNGPVLRRKLIELTVAAFTALFIVESWPMTKVLCLKGYVVLIFGTGWKMYPGDRSNDLSG